MNRSEKLALLLGMLSGDGCLSISHNGQGYRDYPIQFVNTNKELVDMFNRLFLDIFNIEGKLYFTDRKNKQRLWEFKKRSKEVYYKIRKTGFPEGRKKDVLKVPELIKFGSDKEKIVFITGFLITDGCLRNNKSILFHSGSKVFLEDLSLLIKDFTGNAKSIKEYTQREVYKSYQLSLNKSETKILLDNVPLWDNGTPLALRDFLKIK